jgi:hypothetical protein
LKFNNISKTSLVGFWKNPAGDPFISVWQSIEHIAAQTRNAGMNLP